MGISHFMVWYFRKVGEDLGNGAADKSRLIIKRLDQRTLLFSLIFFQHAQNPQRVPPAWPTRLLHGKV